jgi:uncharacterized protein YqgC (DUF456 family)
MALVTTLDRHGRVVVRGLAALQALRTTLQEATSALGVQVYMDQHSEPMLADYLGVAGLSAAEDALKGAALGLLLGALLGAPRDGLLLGAALGAGVGVARGVDRVTSGWRIQMFYDDAGVPTALVSAG